MRARSIPEEHEAKVLHWYLKGDSYQAMIDRLSGEHRIETSPSSIVRLVDRISEGQGSEAVRRAVTKLRLKAPGYVDTLDAHVEMASTRAGVDYDMEIREDVQRADIDLAVRILSRRLKMAGCLGAEADKAMARLRRLTEERCREEELEAGEAPSGSQPSPIPQPPPEPVRASSNGEILESGGGPPPPLSVTLKPQPRPIPQPPPERLRAASNDHFSASHQPYVAPPKQGRNEPCACGSHRKFKKCCGSPTIPPHVTAALQALAS